MNRRQRVSLALITLFTSFFATQQTQAQGREDGCDGTWQQLQSGPLANGGWTMLLEHSNGTMARGMFVDEGESEWSFWNNGKMWFQEGGWPEDCPQPPEEAPTDDPTDEPTDSPKGGGTTTTTTTVIVIQTTTTTTRDAPNTPQQSTRSNERTSSGGDFTLEEELEFLMWLDAERLEDVDGADW